MALLKLVGNYAFVSMLFSHSTFPKIVFRRLVITHRLEGLCGSCSPLHCGDMTGTPFGNPPAAPVLRLSRITMSPGNALGSGTSCSLPTTTPAAATTQPRCFELQLKPVFEGLFSHFSYNCSSGQLTISSDSAGGWRLGLFKCSLPVSGHMTGNSVHHSVADNTTVSTLTRALPNPGI